MFGSDNYLNAPGLGAAVETFERQFTWGHPILTVLNGGQIDGAARDAGSTVTSNLRPGLLLGRITSTGNLKEYNSVGSDGSNEVVGVLAAPCKVVDLSGSNQVKFAPVMFAGPVKAAQLLLLDEQARAQMYGRFIFDDRNGNGNMFGWRQTLAKTADYTIVNGTDNNVFFTNQGAGGAVVFTLPTTISAGQKFGVYIEAGQTVTIAAPAGKLVVFNNAAATSIAFSTSAEKIGVFVEITVNADATKYLAIVHLPAETVTPTIA